MIRQASSPGKNDRYYHQTNWNFFKEKASGGKNENKTTKKEEGDVINYLYIVHQKWSEIIIITNWYCYNASKQDILHDKN